MKRLTNTLKALASVTALLILLAGIPLALTQLHPLHLPTTLPTLEQVTHALTTPDDGTLILSAITLLAWAGWASFALATILEVPAALTSWHPPKIPGLGTQQALARTLVTTALIGLALPTTALAATPQPQAPTTYTLQTTTQQAPTPQEQEDQTPAPTKQPATQATHTVQQGESLWDIAQSDLGQAERWTEIADLNQGTPQPDGQALTDPSIIQPGWNLTLPTTTPPTQAATAPQDQQEDQAPGEQEDQAPGEQEDQAPGEQEDQAPGEQEEGSSWISMSTAITAGGIASALAMSLVGLIAYRRRRAQHDRPLGSRISAPDPDDSLLEAQLRQVADPLEMTTVDRALRALATTSTQIPDIRAARMKRDVLELYLHQPTTLPDPWVGTADKMVWAISSQDLPTQPPDAPAPFPSLVTLGVDDEGAQVLVDLEHVRSLDLRGPQETTMSAMAAMATELSLSPWADDIQITLVGLLPDLAKALDVGRVRHTQDLDKVINELRHRAQEISTSLANEDMTLPQARTQGSAATWSPEIILVPSTITQEQATALDELVSTMPHVGVAMVSEDGSGAQWSLNFANEGLAVLEPAGITIHPQLLSPTDYARILALLNSTSTYTPAPTWAQHIKDLQTPDLAQAANATKDPQPLEHTPAPAQVHEITPRPQATLHDLNLTVPTTQPHLTPEELDGPWLRILGPVELNGARGTEPAPTQRQRLLELLSFLALNPNGVDHSRIDNALWAGKQVRSTTRNTQISRARRWLGVNNQDNPYLPLVPSTPTGGHGWHLEGVDTDWDTFQQLATNNPTTAPLSDLTHALDLVTGTPLTGNRRTSFTWADAIRQDLISTITDTAHVLATRALVAGHPLIAQHAARQALLATHDEERIWRDLLTATALLGQDTRALVEELTNHLADLDLEPEDTTLDLINQLAQPHPIAANA